MKFASINGTLDPKLESIGCSRVRVEGSFVIATYGSWDVVFNSMGREIFRYEVQTKKWYRRFLFWVK
jgi:hypothetical protein